MVSLGRQHKTEVITKLVSSRLTQEERQTKERCRTAERNFQGLSAALLEEAEVSVCPDGLLHFHDTVIVHAPVVTPRKGAPRPPIACTLAATPSRQCLLKNVYYDVPLTASPDHHKPLVKNVFTIRPRDPRHDTSSSSSSSPPLHYGDPFDLTYTTPGGKTLHVTSPVGSALHSSRESRRQEVLLKEGSSAHSAWKLVPSDPHLRLTMQGEPAQVGARVWLVQTMTNQPMVVEEEFTTNTLFNTVSTAREGRRECRRGKRNGSRGVRE
ncbi:hypothetical protein Pmani_005796 [Petrolisthes manimaculis]|uniref:Uncharacterized protein n=1 Tax=Petrolisthes manimaculis TaxID=1843537 RepID=A0AAE1QD44_9EUCA|nr:hypothetical protein Pmani_005796 [Petrolisthes manimaculis]